MAVRIHDNLPILSGREVEVLREVSRGLSMREIAARLRISSRTVATNMRHIYEKLGAQTPTQAVARAVSLGYLELDKVDFARFKALTTQKVLEYLHDAYNDRFNEFNFPIDAHRIARDLGISLETVIASGDELAREKKVERIEPAYGYPASYRLIVPSHSKRHRVEAQVSEPATVQGKSHA